MGNESEGENRSSKSCTSIKVLINFLEDDVVFLLKLGNNYNQTTSTPRGLSKEPGVCTLPCILDLVDIKHNA